MNSFILFCKDAREQTRAEDPFISSFALTRKLASLWKHVDPKTKQWYQDQAARIRNEKNTKTRGRTQTKRKLAKKTSGESFTTNSPVLSSPNLSDSESEFISSLFEEEIDWRPSQIASRKQIPESRPVNQIAAYPPPPLYQTRYDPYKYHITTQMAPLYVSPYFQYQDSSFSYCQNQRWT
uniref:HMG box domain-containing protein n=1 Tax=Vannella robusta TaxID=1487602 RepID=A0A7S4I7F6_9EUKA|mmetsp:Transcript_21589/g.27462  ORF Transcript_21589/g.27462 Transcript_21589/m.27462 type:complete len:180 (+) Transcript_21589:98-637(+)